MVNALAGLGDGAQIARDFQSTFDNSRLNRLAGEAYSAPQDQRQSILGQMASISPRAAQTQQQQWQTDEDRTLKQLTGAARYLKGAMDTNNPQAVQGAWRTVLPGLIRSGVVKEGELSPTWDPSYADTVHQVLAMGEGRGGAGGVIQSQKISDDGYIINTYRDGRMEKTGQKVDRQAWLRDQPGLPVGIVGKDASFTPLGGSEELPANGWTDVGEGGSRVRFNVNEFTPQQQERVARTVSMMQQAGYSDDEIGQFVQSQMPQQVSNIGAPRSPAGGPTRSLNRPSAAEDAAAVEAAKQRAQLQYLPQELGMRTEAAIRQAEGTQMAKDKAERAAQAPKRIRQYEQAIGAADSVMTSLDKAISLIGPTTTGWGGARLRGIEGTDAYNLAAEIETVKANLGFDRLQQMRDNSPTGGALGAIAVQELVALQSTVANLDPNQSAEQIKQNLERVKKHYEGWVSAVQQALADELRGSQGQSQAAVAGQRTVVRTGTSNGRRVVQYSDGSVEYGN